jgi:hypothetical protein
VAMSNKLLMHYRCDTVTGHFMQASHSLFLLELGISLQPLQESFDKCSFLSTYSWMKMVWEKISKFGVRTVIPDTGMAFPREGDQFIMQAFFKKGYSREILLRLNRVRIYLQALFISDILTASGNKINTEMTAQSMTQRKQLRLRWPIEHPTGPDFQLWRDAVRALCPSRDNRTRMGPFIAPTHRIWNWRWDKGSGSLCQSSKDGETEDVFRLEKKPNRCYYSETRAYTGQGIICSVEPTHAGQIRGGWRLTSWAQEATPAPTHKTFMDVLYSWGDTWLWDNILMAGATIGCTRQYKMGHSWRSPTARISMSDIQICAQRHSCLSVKKGEDV